MLFLLCIFVGSFFIIIKTLNMFLANEVGVYKSSIMNQLMGLLGCGIFIVLFLRTSTFTPSKLVSIGIFPLLGGIFGASFVALSNYTFSKTSVLISTLLILVGQTAASILLDYLFLDKLVSLNTLIGISLIGFAIYFQSDRKSKSAKAKSIS